MPQITPNLWFDMNGLEAAEFYVSVFPNSEITSIVRYTDAGPGPAGTVMLVEFSLDGQPYTAINGGPQFSFDEAISLLINCADQAEADHYWTTLTEGGEESQCGWLKDKFGLSWQVFPIAAADVLGDPDPGPRPARDQRDVRDAQDRSRRSAGRGRRRVKRVVNAVAVATSPRVRDARVDVRRGRQRGKRGWFIHRGGGRGRATARRAMPGSPRHRGPRRDGLS